MPLDQLPVNDKDYWALPYIACATEPAVLSEYGLHNRSAVWRRGSFLNPALFDYVDRLCMDEKYDNLMWNLHEILLSTYIGMDGRVYVKNDEQTEQRLGNLGITGTLVGLRQIFADREAEPLIDDIEESLRRAKVIFTTTRPLTMHFRTIEELSVGFHIDTPHDVYGLSYGPSCTELGPLSSFTKLPSIFNEKAEKKFFYNEGAPLFKLDRGDASILKIPHRAGVLESREEAEKYREKRLWVGIYKHVPRGYVVY